MQNPQPAPAQPVFFQEGISLLSFGGYQRISKVTIPKLIAKTGLSRGFFYKNPMVRQALDKALEQQVGMIDPRRSVLDMAMDNEIVALHERIRELQQENQRLRAENEKMQKALSRRNDKLLRNL